MADWKETEKILSGGMDERNEKLEKNAIKSVIDAIKENAGSDPQEQIQALENALYGMAGGFFQEREKRRQAEAETAAIQDLLKRAWAEFKSPEHERLRERATAFFSYLGWNTKKGEKTNKLNLFHEYMNLITGGVDIETWEHKEPLSKEEAIEVLKDRYDINSTDAVIEQLRVHISERKKQAKKRGEQHGLKKIIPWRSEHK